MKILSRYILLCSILLSVYASNAQSKTTTVIVVRHAEKEAVTSGDQMMKADPPLSAAGKTRAENLVSALGEFSPGAVFSSNYERTKATVTPLASKHGISIQYYDPRNQGSLADKIKTMEGETIVVAGHSNTVPALVNMLIGEQGKYPDLDESVYNKIYIVKITDGKATVEIREY